MGKDKLKRFAEIATFSNVLQPSINNFKSSIDLKGKWHNVFKNSNPIVIELGCGKGEYSVGLGKNHNSTNFIGVDGKGSRIWRGAKTCIEEKFENVRVFDLRPRKVNQSGEKKLFNRFGKNENATIDFTLLTY